VRVVGKGRTFLERQFQPEGQKWSVMVRNSQKCPEPLIADMKRGVKTAESAAHKCVLLLEHM
jgi:hypothetical protein